MSKLFCKFLAPWKGRVLFVCPELALTHFAMKTSISVAVRESRDGIGVVKLPIGYAKALLPEAEILSVHNHWEEDWSQSRQ